MKEKIISKGLVVLIVFFIPIFITTLFTDFGKKMGTSNGIMVHINYTEGEKDIPLEHYLIGVVAAEMPVEFEEEALKAQAVAARTYTMKRYLQDPNMVFNNDVQSYYSDEELEALWGVNDYAFYYSKIRNAVEDTSDVIITFEGALIDAVFHSTSNGMTRSAKDVWGQDIAYLQEAESLEDINAPTYLHKYNMSYDEFKEKAASYDSEITFTKDLSSEIQIIERNKAGYIIEVQIGNKIYSGEDFRKIFGLASSNFSILFADNQVEIVCKGYGHGVGLSQYGADAMAKTGLKFEDILSHYYKNINLDSLSETMAK